VVHCNYGSIWLRFRDMTRDRQTDIRTVSWYGHT